MIIIISKTSILNLETRTDSDETNNYGKFQVKFLISYLLNYEYRRRGT